MQGPSSSSAATRHAVLLAILLAVTWAKLLAMSILVPMWQAPDEESHSVAVAAWMYDPAFGWTSRQTARPLILEQAYDHGPYTQNLLQLNGNVGRRGGRPEYVPGLWGINEGPLHQPTFADAKTRLPPGFNSTLSYPQAYYAAVGLVTRATLPAQAQNFLNVMFVARWTGAVWAALTVIGVYALVWWLTESTATTFAVTLAYSCNGLMTYLTAIINPDGALFGLYAVAAAALVRLWTAGRMSVLGWIVLFAATAAAPLIKPNGLILPVFVVGLFALAWLVSRTRLGHVRISLGLATIAAVSVALHLANLRLKGPVSLNGESEGWRDMNFTAYLYSIYKPMGEHLARNLIGQYGWFDVDHSVRLYVGSYAWLLAGTLLFVVRRPRDPLLEARPRQAVLLLLAAFVATVVAMFLHQYWAMLRTVGFQVQARYFAFGFVALYVAAGLGLRRFGPTWLGASLMTLWLALCVFTPYQAAKRINQRFYDAKDWPTFVERVSQYKPAFIKGVGVEATMIAAAALLVIAFVVAVALLVREAWVERRAIHDSAASPAPSSMPRKPCPASR